MSEPTMYLETHAAIERFLTGEYNAAQLHSWMLGHFEHDRADEPARELWGVAMLFLAVYPVADLPRDELAESLRMVRDSDNPGRASLHTPLMQNPNFRAVAFGPNPPWPIKPYSKSAEAPDG